jgi:DNA-binding response OmpR family regulator
MKSSKTRKNKTSRILLVEDHVDLNLVLKVALERVGFVVESATTFQAAIDRVVSNSFDLLVCDIMLGDGSGWDVVQHWNSQSKRPSVAMSAMEPSVGMPVSIAKGFDRYLAKPFPMATLIKTVQDLLTV